MKILWFNIVFLFPFFLSTSAQTNDFQIRTWTTAVTKTPLVFYISGDGGLNKFSDQVCITINKTGYCITALNAKSYFWNKKSPQTTANDISNFIESALANRTNQQWVLVGYSFGADVSPFIITKLSPKAREKLQSLVLLSPTTSTDFEIHFSDMFGIKEKRIMDVVAEMNKMGTLKTTTLFGSDEKEFPIKRISLPHYKNQFLEGDHHFDGNIAQVAKAIIANF